MKWTLIKEMPSTNVRMAVSFVCVLATATRVLWPSNPPWDVPLDWLAFLSLWGGLDVAQFVQKRKTQQVPPAGQEGGA